MATEVAIRTIRPLRDGRPMPKPHSEAYERLKLLIREKGLLNPVLIDAGGNIVDGYGEYRWYACCDLGHKRIRVEQQ